jgi:serine/threonine protein kinase
MPGIILLFGYSIPTGTDPARLATLFTDGCTLADVLSSPPEWWTPTTISNTVVVIFLGVKYIHGRCAIHRDIKPSNIVLDKESLEVRVCDFGSGRVSSVLSSRRRHVRARQYMGPDMYEEADYRNKVDGFSFGLILYEIVTETPVFGRH